MTPLHELGCLFGRVLVACFTSWWSEHPSVFSEHGHLFAQNISETINQYSKDGFFKDIGLEKVDFFTISKALFYSDSSSHYYHSKNLQKGNTFLELWEKYDSELGINCQNPNRILCKIKGYLGSSESTYVKDFRLTDNLFLAQYYGSEHYIPRNVYYTDNEIDRRITKDTPRRYLNYPTLPQFERILINKNLQARSIGIQRYGLNVYDNTEYPDENSLWNNTHGFLLDTFYHNSKLAGLFMELNEVSASSDSFMIWPSIPIDIPNRPMFYSSVKEKHLDFYPYSRQPFRVVNNIISFGKTFDVGDRYYRISEEEERGGYSDEYNSVWIFSDLTGHDNSGEGTIADNLTSFAECLNTSSYQDCSSLYMPWFDFCKGGESEICQKIEDNLQSLNITISPVPSKDNDLLAWLSYSAIAVSFLVSIITLSLIIIIHNKTRIEEDSRAYGLSTEYLTRTSYNSGTS